MAGRIVRCKACGEKIRLAVQEPEVAEGRKRISRSRSASGRKPKRESPSWFLSWPVIAGMAFIGLLLFGLGVLLAVYKPWNKEGREALLSGKAPPSASRNSVAIYIAQDGRCSALPDGTQMKEVKRIEEEEFSDFEGGGEVKSINPAGFADKITQICKELELGPGEDGGLRNFKIEELTLPLRIRLVWNAPLGKCRISVGSIFHGYDDQGLKRASKACKQILQTGVTDMEIESGEDVHFDNFLKVLSMVSQLDPKELEIMRWRDSDRNIPNVASFDFKGKGEKVKISIFCHPETKFKDLYPYLRVCDLAGARKILIGTSPGNSLQLTFPWVIGEGYWPEEEDE
ncbi:MAG: hypothetical protein ACYTHM_20565 [Planctomycetota bacterium]